MVRVDQICGFMECAKIMLDFMAQNHSNALIGIVYVQNITLGEIFQDVSEPERIIAGGNYQKHKERKQ